MSKFLDETGLSYFWNKIKAALANVAFSGSYNDLSNKPTIPTVDSSLSSTSTNPVQNKVINTALGTKANDSDVVHITGNETIDGHKDFQQSIRFCSDIAFVNQSFVKGTAPSSSKNTSIIFIDKVDNLTPGIFPPVEHRMAIIRQFYGTAGNNALQFFVYYPSSANNSYFYLTLNTNADGSNIYFAPSIAGVCTLGLTNNRWSTIYTQYVDATQFQGTQAALNLSTTFTSAKEYWPFYVSRNSADTTNSSGNLMQLGVQQLANSQNFRIQLRVANPRGGNLPSSTTSEAATGNCWASIGVLYDYNLNKAYPECLNCTSWGVSDDSSNHLATTAWVRAATGNTALNAATATRMLINNYSGDIDDLKTSGFYYAVSGNVTNLPVGFNGQIIVIDKGNFKRQIYMRSGTPGTNDHQIYSRQFHDVDNTWGPWFYFLTSKHLPLSAANGGTGLTSLDTFVRTTGNQSIAGVKTFTDTLIIEEATPNIYIRDTNFAKGDTITSSHYNYINFGGSDTTDSNPKRLGAVGLVVSANDTRMNLFAFQNVANSSNGDGLRIIYPNTGSCYATAPTTPTGATGTEIITADYFNSNVVKLSGDQSIAGIKTFSSPVVITHDNVSVRRSNKTGALCLTGGNSESAADGAMLSLFGSSHSSLAGYFRLYTGNGPCLEGRPNGTLTWNDRYFIYADGDQTIGGTKTISAANLKFSANAVNVVKELSGNPSSTREIDIGIKNTASDVNGYMAVSAYWWSSMNAGVSIAFKNPNETTYPTYSVVLRPWSNAVAYFMPNNTNVYLGRNASGYKWKQLIAETTTISTSDERLKSSIDAIPDAVLDAWGDVNWRQFQFKDAVAEKGVDKARLHTGLIAQRIDSVFKAYNLDVSRYGLWCVDHWDATSEELDEKGNIVTPAREAEDAYAVRYEEALCIEAAYQRRRADRAEARITALEQRLNELEEVLATLGDHSNAS